MSEQKNQQLVPAVAAALIIYILLSYIEGFISLPLREASSYLSYLILNLANIGIEQNGTMLSTPRMNFDVVPACSGSTTLKVMIFSGIIWANLQIHFSKSYKLLISLSVIPISLFANALRLSFLVLIGHHSYTPVTGILHEITGVAAFLGAFGMMIWQTKFLSSKSHPVSKESYNEASVIVILLAAIYYLPTVAWIYNGWIHSPLDKFGYLFFLVAALFLTFKLKHSNIKEDNSSKLVATFLVMHFLIEIILHFTGINILRALNMLCLGGIFIYAYWGKKQLIHCLPYILIMALSFPTISFMINKILTNVTSTNIATALVTKTVLTLLLIVAAKYLKTDSSRSQNSSSFSALPFIISLSLYLSFGLMFSHKSDSKPIHSSLNLSYLLDGWLGKNTKFMDESPYLWSRLYIKNDKRIKVIINASAGDRNSLHPPEYCLTGSGWKLSQENVINWTNKQITEMRLDKADLKKYFYHWYSDGTSYFKSYKEMLTEDSLRRLRGIRTNWFLFRIIADSPEPVTESFLKSFTGSFKSSEEVFNF